MILPIYLYGHPILRKEISDIPIGDDLMDLDTMKELNELTENLFETMYKAEGVGLAGPQVGLEKRILVLDLSLLADEDASFAGFKRVFINPHIIECDGEEENVEEGCLSIPNIREKVARKNRIRIQYLDENLEERDEVYEGYKARVVQHEYDHLEGILFVDRIPGLRKQMIRSKLNRIMEGKVNCAYRTIAFGKK